MGNSNRYLIDTVQLPTWSLCALVNGDDSGLEEEELSALDHFEKRYPLDKFIIDYGTEEYYSNDNELTYEAGDVVDCKIYRIPRKYNRKVKNEQQK